MDAMATASASYKKQGGRLELRQDDASTSAETGDESLVWLPDGASASSSKRVVLPGARLTSLFSSKETAAKVMLRVGLAPQGTTATASSGDAEHFAFTFTNASSAVSDREKFKGALSVLIARNRATTASGSPSTAAPSPAAAAPSPAPVARAGTPMRASAGPSAGASRSGTPGVSAQQQQQQQQQSILQDYTLRAKALQRDQALASLHRELVVQSKAVSESEFWDGRESILLELAAEDRLTKGKSAKMVDPRPEVASDGKVTVKITPTLVQEIFEEFPAVARAYAENVPSPLDNSQFWTRYFQSKLFNRNRSTNRAAVSTIKDDAIFDKYLDLEDDDVEPRNLPAEHIYKLLDLAATEEDQHEVRNEADFTMKPGSVRSSLPLIRRFNEHSQRLLNASLGPAEARSTSSGIDPGNAGARGIGQSMTGATTSEQYYREIELDDLRSRTSQAHITLDLQDPSGVGASGGAAGGAHQDVNDEMDGEDAALRKAKRRKFFHEKMLLWQPDLANFSMEHSQVESAVKDLQARIVAKATRSSREDQAGSLPDWLVRSASSLHLSTSEFLRQFWHALLPPAPHDISATARAPPAKRAARAQAMKVFIDGTPDKVAALMTQAEGEDQRARLEAALRPTLQAVEAAQRFYEQRMGAK